MRTQTRVHWLALVLIALAGFLSPPAFAGWADVSRYLPTIATPRAFDRTNGQIFSYVTIQNNAPGPVTGPLRLVIPSSQVDTRVRTTYRKTFGPHPNSSAGGRGA